MWVVKKLVLRHDIGQPGTLIARCKGPPCVAQKSLRALQTAITSQAAAQPAHGKRSASCALWLRLAIGARRRHAHEHARPGCGDLPWCDDANARRQHPTGRGQGIVARDWTKAKNRSLGLRPARRIYAMIRGGLRREKGAGGSGLLSLTVSGSQLGGRRGSSSASFTAMQPHLSGRVRATPIPLSWARGHSPKSWPAYVLQASPNQAVGQLQTDSSSRTRCWWFRPAISGLGRCG